MVGGKGSETLRYAMAALVGIFLSYVLQKQSTIKFGMKNENLRIQELFTSALCQGSDMATRTCVFDNICYQKKTGRYVLLVSPESSIVGMNISHMENVVHLGGDLRDDKGFMAFDTVFMDKNIKDSIPSFQYEAKPLLQWLHRSSPSRLGLIFHLDLIPLYLTYRIRCQGDTHKCTDVSQLLIADKLQSHSYLDLIALFSNEPLLFLQDYESEFTCFSNAFTGLERTPLSVGNNEQRFSDHLSITGFDLIDFADFIVKRICNHGLKFLPYSSAIACHEFNATLCSPEDENTIVILSGVSSPGFENIEEITKALSDAYKSIYNVSSVSVKMVNLENTHIFSAICDIRSAKLLIGHHDDTLELSLFLRPGSGFIEMIQFGDIPQTTPFKIMSKMRGRKIAYDKYRNRIIDPSTDKIFVNINSLIPSVHNVLNLMSKFDLSLSTELPMKIRPAKVLEIKCKRYDGKLKIICYGPWNADHMGPDELTYVVGIKPKQETTMEIGVSNSSDILVVDAHPEQAVEIMVQTLSGKIAGEIRYGECPEASHPIYLDMTDEEEEVEEQVENSNNTKSNATEEVPGGSDSKDPDILTIKPQQVDYDQKKKVKKLKSESSSDATKVSQHDTKDKTKSEEEEAKIIEDS